ncbi:hypothetical protein NE237_008865 [Protea cynaroides]|uniref:Amino acid transporter transmembrane domain-containing protein n=1 Tax=Protea cynaroides TaxID=273540 RepID=A0A9Q0QZQ9_9MAGN|nr:hypothetical protein NE237_008865 [Protea cynaroides]
MGTPHPNSVAHHHHHHHHKVGDEELPPLSMAETHEPNKDSLDAGALFVLKSKGSWLHCGYHLTTAIVAPPVLSLPYAIASLGWIGGVVFLMVATMGTFYSYNLVSLVLEHHAQKGKRLLRFTDMAEDIMGITRMGHIFRLSYSILALLWLRYGLYSSRSSVHEGNHSSPSEREDVQGTMRLLCCSDTFFSVSISGYWAFGNQAAGSLLSNFYNNGQPLVPNWFLFMINALTLIQVSAVGLVYLQPTNEILERNFADPKKGEFSICKVVPRLISRSLSVAVATLIVAAMFPFFGDINGVIGAFGWIPLDFVLPMIFFNLTFKPTK